MIKKTSSKYIKSTVSDDGAMPRSRPGSREGDAARNNHDLSPAEESNVIRLFLTFSSVVVYSDSESGGDAPASPMSVVNRQLNFSELRALLACQGLAVTDEVFEKLKEDLQLKIPDEISFDEFLAFMSRSQTLRELRTESIAQSKEHVQKFNNRRFQADTVWRWVWDVMVLVTTLYYMLVVPLEWVDRHHDVPQRDLWAWETIASIFFILDMCVFANTVKLDQHGKSVDDLKAVVVFYLKRNFVFDLLGTLPIDLIIEWAYPDTFVTMTAWRVLRSMRVLRLVRIFSLFTGASVNGYLQPAFVYLQYTVGPVLLAIFYFTVLVHILSVTWLGVVLATTPDGLSSAYSNTEKWNYLGALYTVVYTLFTIGYGDMQILGVEQRLFMCFLFIGGALMNGLVISQMSVFLQKANIQNDRQDKMRETLAVLTHFDIPADTQSEILSFQHHLLSHNLGSTHEELMGSLPETIQESLGLFARIKFIALVPMFASSPHDCKEALATRLTNIIFHPNEFIIIAGEVGQEMYFLGHGVADVIGAGGQHFATLRQGAFFGEIALLVEGAARTASIKALTYCDTFRLERNDFDRILAKFPQFRQSMEAEVADRVEKFKESQAKNPPRSTIRTRQRSKRLSQILLPVHASAEDTSMDELISRLSDAERATTDRRDTVRPPSFRVHRSEHYKAGEPIDTLHQPKVHRSNSHNSHTTSANASLTHMPRTKFNNGFGHAAPPAPAIALSLPPISVSPRYQSLDIDVHATRLRVPESAVRPRSPRSPRTSPSVERSPRSLSITPRTPQNGRVHDGGAVSHHHEHHGALPGFPSILYSENHVPKKKHLSFHTTVEAGDTDRSGSVGDNLDMDIREPEASLPLGAIPEEVDHL